MSLLPVVDENACKTSIYSKSTIKTPQNSAKSG